MLRRASNALGKSGSTTPLCTFSQTIMDKDLSAQMTLHSLYKANFAAKTLLLGLHFRAKSGHVGSALSCAEILTFIRSYCWETEATLVLSKGHAASALYSVLATAGDISETSLRETYYKDGSLFSAHPPPNKLPNIPFATGSLGHGPGICNGLAFGAKLKTGPDHAPAPVFCVLSDGELNEGSVWESFAFAAHHQLDNLTFFIDRNRLQGFGKTSEVLNLEPLVDKLRAFGLSVAEADGHHFPSLIEAFEQLANDHRGPKVIVADTVKGRGLPEVENTVDCHYLPMTPAVFEGALAFCEREFAALTSTKQVHAPCESNLPKQ
jgi:transketolase